MLGALLSSLASWSLQQTLPVSEKRTQGADHSFTQPQAWLFDRQGRLAYQATGSQLEHRTESGDYVLEQARLTVHPTEESADGWLIEAEQARFLTNREAALLGGNVTAQRQHVADQDAITIKARDVVLDLVTHIATSSEPMMAEGQHWQSQSETFKADFSTEQLSQQGRVHDRHEPPRP